MKPEQLRSWPLMGAEERQIVRKLLVGLSTIEARIAFAEKHGECPRENWKDCALERHGNDRKRKGIKTWFLLFASAGTGPAGMTK